jgi:excisionase family DNA binding protein
MKPIPLASLLRVHEVADHCSVSQKTVRRWINEGGLPTHRLPGAGSRGITLVSREDLESWLAGFRHREPAKDDEPVIHLAGRRLLK